VTAGTAYARRLAIGLAVASSLLALPAVRAQETPVQRVANIVSVAVEEYGKAFDAKGALVAPGEYQEALDFLDDARRSAARLPLDARAAAARALLDSITTAIHGKERPTVLTSLAQRFVASLGSEAALELPRGAVDIADGQRIFAASCASCHGADGAGNGPAAASLNPRPPSIGSGDAMDAESPAMAFRKISIGVTGTAMPAFASQLSPTQRWNVVAYLVSLRERDRGVADGEGTYVQSCAACHGVSGRADGALTRALTKLPPEIGTLAWQAERSDSALAGAVRDGVPGTPMPPAPWLTRTQGRNVVAYMRGLALTGRTGSVAARQDTGSAPAAATTSISLLEQSLAAARDGRASDASDRAFDAYLAFEPIETPARARDPGVVASMERRFAEFKAAVRADDIRGAERARDAIEANMTNVVELTRPASSAHDAFWESFLIIVREGFEAILVIGAIVAFLLKTGHRERLRAIWTGIVLGLLASAATAVVLETVLSAIPASREIIEGFTLLVAVAVLFSVSYWLISRVEAARWQQFIREKVTRALEQGGGRALAFVAFLAVYREGAETALFYQALFNEGAHVALAISLGLVAGFVVLGIVFTLFYRYGVRIPLRPFFSVTSLLLYYMALVFMGKGVRELQEGNAIGISTIPGFPTVDALGLYPTWQTVLAQMLLLALLVFAVAKTFWPRRSVTLPMVEPVDAPRAAAQAALEAELERLRAQNAELAARLTALERRDGSGN
jgi:high-affinity iron transporter